MIASATPSSSDTDKGSPFASLPAITAGVDMSKLLGTPHLFCRMKELRNGVLIEPLGQMTLQPDGRVTGYSHPNEGSWVPYSHGEVPGEQAFAFITRQNQWIPSSTWTQSMGDIPVGFFCDEPEQPSAMQRLCLLPQTPLPPQTSIVYLVASCLRFYERTVPALLAQLFAEGIRPEQIKVVVNGCTENADRVIDGVDHGFTTHDAWEWSALYEAPLRWRFDYGFLLHDTNVIFPGFRRSVESFNGHVAWDHLPASPLARCLLGLYSRSFLMRLNSWLQGIDHIDKQNGVLAEAAGELLLRARTALVISDAERNGSARAAEWRELVDYFNSGSVRARRVFPSIKLHKFIHTGTTNATHL